MAYIQFTDLVPPVRSAPDAAKWNRYRLEASVDGVTWNSFEAASLSPQVADAKNPPTYSFVSVDAPDNAVYFRVVWLDVNNVEQPILPLIRPYPLPAWAPGMGDVAAFIPSRTKLPGNGVYANTFNEKTHPTNLQVAAAISKAVEDVVPLTGRIISDPDEANSAKNLAAMRAAMLIELGLFSEQVNTDRSPYDRFKQIWDDETGSDATGADNSDSVLGSRAPSYAFARYSSLIERCSVTNIEDGNYAPGTDRDRRDL